MSVIYVGIGDYAASKVPEQTIKTLALGSCVAVIMLDTRQRTVGMLHVALPDSCINKEKASTKPGMFADTGIPRLIEEMQKLGYNGNNRLVIKLAGGASIMDPNQTFNIGKRNILAVRKCLWQHKFGAIAEDIGGNFSRSVSIDIKTGKVLITSPGRGGWEL